MAKYTVGDLTDMIKRNARMDLALLGSNVTEQNNYIFNYLTLALWKYAGLVFYVRTSDPIEVTTNGPVTFQIDGADVEDMYSQQYILNANGQKVTKRSAFDDKSNGWFREGFNQQLDIRGAGTYTLVYRAYHPKITATNQELLWPQTSYNLLMYETIGKIKQSKNDDSGASAAFSIADKEIPILVKSTEDAYGNTGGPVPSQAEVSKYRK